mgnify:FL=1
MSNQYERVEETTRFYISNVTATKGRDDNDQWRIEGKWPWTPQYPVTVWVNKDSSPSWLNPIYTDEQGQPQVKEAPYDPPYEANVVAGRGQVSNAGERGCQKCFNGQGHTSGTSHDGSQNYHYKWYINDWNDHAAPERKQMTRGSQPHTFTAPNIVQQAPQQQQQQQQQVQQPKTQQSQPPKIESGNAPGNTCQHGVGQTGNYDKCGRCITRICAFNGIENKDKKDINTIKFLTDQYELILSGQEPDASNSEKIIHKDPTTFNTYDRKIQESQEKPTQEDDQMQRLIEDEG